VYFYDVRFSSSDDILQLCRDIAVSCIGYGSRMSPEVPVTCSNISFH
jgi:hypothetical protein